MAVNTLNFGSKVVFVSGVPLTLPVAASDPGSAVAGDMYYNSVSNLVRFYTGSAWMNGNDGGVASNVTATSNATLTTLSALTTASSLASVGTITSGTWNATTIAILHGGTGATSANAAFANLSPLSVAGDIIYENATPAPARLPIGSNGTVLTVVSGLPAWAAPSSGYWSANGSNDIYNTNSGADVGIGTSTPYDGGGMLTIKSPTGMAALSDSGTMVLAGTPADGAVIAGLGSAFDLTLQNGSNAEVWQVPTGTTNSLFSGSVSPSADQTYSSGSVGAAWTGVYAKQFYAPSGADGIVMDIDELGNSDGIEILNSGGPGQLDIINFSAMTLRNNGSHPTGMPLNFYDNATTSTHYVGFRAPDTLTGSTDYVWPSADGTGGYVLSTNGSGVLSWIASSSGANTALSNLASVAINTSLLPGADNTINLGSASFSWANASIHSLLAASGTSVDVYGRALKDSSSATQLSWSTSGITITALAANVPAAGFKLTGLGAGTTAGDSVRYQQAILTSGVNAWAANQDLGGNIITGSGTPVNPNDLARKSYVDNLVQGLNWKQTAVSATTTALSGTYAYNNGASGVGATITQNGTISGHALNPQDGVTLTVGQRLLVKNETGGNLPYNGIYTVTQVGDGATVPYILTRATDADTAAKLQWATLEIGADATSQAGEIWREADDITTIGTDPVAFTQVSQGTAYIFTSGVQISGNTVSANVDNSTIDVNGSQQLEVKTGGITNTQVSASAAIAYSKLALSNSIVNADINASAAIAYSKLNLSNSIVNADINAAAAIAYSKLNLSGSIVNADIATGAAIAFSKLAALTSAHILVGNGSNVATDVAVSGDLTLANTGAFTVAKIAGTTVSGTTGSTNVVFSASPTLTGTITAAAANFSGAIGANGGITSTGSLLINANAGASVINLESSSFGRSTDGTNFVVQTYNDSITLTDNVSNTAITAFQFAVASFAGEEITYVIETGTATVDTRIGTLRVTANSSGTIAPSISDMYTESADCGVTWTATNSAGTISVKYTTTNQGANRTMRADVKTLRR